MHPLGAMKLSKNSLDQLLKGVIAAMPAIPYIMKSRQRTPIAAYVLGGVGFAIAGGLAAVMMLSPRTRTRALGMAKATYGKVSSKVGSQWPVIGKHGQTHEENGLSNGISHGASYSSPTTTGL